MRRAAAISDEVFERARRGAASSAGPSASSPGGSSELFREAGADGARVRRDRRRRPRTARSPHARAGRRRDRGGRARRRRRRLHASTATAPTARARSRPASCPSELAERLRGLPRGAARRARRRSRPGVHGRDADAAARDVIEAAGFGEPFGHGLGHGVGLEVHEAPTLAPESTDALEAGNVVTVEPGIYLPGWAASGSRTSSLVTDDGRERLTHVHEGADRRSA